MIDIVNEWQLIAQINEEGECINGKVRGLSLRQNYQGGEEQWIYLTEDQLVKLYTNLTDYFEEG